MNAPPGEFEKNSEKTACYEQFPLAKLERNKRDKLGNLVLEIFWLGSDFAIYRTERGVFVHFADCPEEARVQRCNFTEISPELCELRFLTSQMRHVGWLQRFLRRKKIVPREENHGDEDTSFQEDPGDSLFDHNIAQAIMLAMEGKTPASKRLVKATLSMAVLRATNDNTIRYVMSCVLAAMAVFAASPIVIAGLYYFEAMSLMGYVTASLFGTLGAVFSIITRVQAFEMKPCQQSNMNYWMASTRIGIGVMGGFMLFLIADNTTARNLFNPDLFGSGALQNWQGAAVIGFLGGFAERLVRTMFKRTADAMAENSGTPVQLVRQNEGAGSEDKAVP